MKQKSICMKQIIYIVTACVFVLVSPVKAQRIYSLKDCLEAVSYTHLTLPTNSRV